MKDAVKEWIKQAKDELDMALYLFQGGFLREGVCCPLGEPSSSEAKRALEIAENTYSSIPVLLKSGD